MGLVRVYPVNDFTSAIAGTALQVDDVDTVGIQVSSATVAGVDEVQVLTPSGAITGGTWTITYAGQTTSALAHTADAATISAALDALSNLGVGDLVATGGPISSGAVTLTAAAALAATPIAQVTVTTTSLTGTTAEITPTTTTAGVAAVNEVQLITPAGSITGGTWTITYSGQTTSALAYNANAAAITAALVALSNVASGDMVASGGPISSAPVTITIAGALAATNIDEITVDAGSLTNTAASLTPSTVTVGVAAVDEIQILTPAGTVSGGTFTITYAGYTSAPIQWDANAATITTALDAMSNLAPGDVVATDGPLNVGPVTLTFGGTLAGTNVAQVTVTSSLTGAPTAAPSTTTAGVAAVDEIQLLTRGGTISGGTWTITYAGQTTSALAFDADAATITTALDALSNLAPGDCIATGGPISTTNVTLTFGGTLAGTNVAEVTVDIASITGGGTLTVSTTTAGVAPINEVQIITPSGTVSGGTYTITYSGQTTSAIAWNANGATITAALDALSNLAPADCVATGNLSTGVVTLTFGGTLAATNVDQVTVDTASLTGAPTLTPSTDTAGVAAVNEVQRLTMAGVPFAGTYTITYSGQTTSAIAYNASNATVQAALSALSNIGADEVVVSAGPLAAGTPIDLTFTGALAATNVDQITASAAGLTYVPTLTPSTTTAGAAPVPEVQRLTTTGTPTGGTFTLSFGGYTTAALAYNATAAQIQAALLDLRSIPASGVTCAGGPINAAFVSVTWADPISNVAQLTVNDDLLTSTTIAVTPSTTTQGVAAVSASWTGTITFQASIDGVNYVSIAGQDTVGTDLTAGVVSTTTNKMFRFDVRGYTMFRPNCTAYTSGTIRTQCTGSRDR